MYLYLNTAVSICSGISKFYLKSTMKEERLNTLTTYSIEGKLIKQINFNTTINTFTHQKARKKI